MFNFISKGSLKENSRYKMSWRPSKSQKIVLVPNEILRVMWEMQALWSIIKYWPSCFCFRRLFCLYHLQSTHSYFKSLDKCCVDKKLLIIYICTSRIQGRMRRLRVGVQKCLANICQLFWEIFCPQNKYVVTFFLSAFPKMRL